MIRKDRDHATRRRINLRACAALIFTLGSAPTASALDGRLLGA